MEMIYFISIANIIISFLIVLVLIFIANSRTPKKNPKKIARDLQRIKEQII